MGVVRECLVMAKPLGARCNLRCSYCYYVGKDLPSPGAPPRMSEALLERYISGRLAASTGPTTHFEWHGGEPTLLGVPFFRLVRRLQRRHCPPGRTITNGIQTNGLPLNRAWAEFLAREGFSVGLSLDGPAPMHDEYRKSAEGEPTHERVVAAFRLLERHGVFCNVLCVLHAANASAPEEVYGFFRDLGVTRLQFLPLVARASGGGVTAATPPPGAVGEFLCAVFDRWIREDVGRVVVQTFDEAIRPHLGVEHALCIHRETCGDVAVLERDGGFYACDHFVDAEHLMGNLAERAFAELASDPRMIAFGGAKRDSLAASCRGCDVLASCNGGCPKDRIVPDPGGGMLNYLCPSYQRFFRHAAPVLAGLAMHVRAGRPLRAFRLT